MILAFLLIHFLSNDPAPSDSVVYINKNQEVAYTGTITGKATFKTILKEIKSAKVKTDNGFVARQIEKKWSLFKISGDKISDTTFQEFSPLDNNTIAVQKRGRWGAIDFQGKTFIPFNYYKIKKSENVFLIKEFSHIEIKDQQFKTDQSFDYEDLKFLDEKFMEYQLGGLYGLYSYPDKKTITQPEFEGLSKFNQTLFLVTKNKKKGIIDRNGKTIIPCDYDEIIKDTLNFIKVMARKYNGLTDEKGNKIIGDYWGIYNLNGRVIIPAIYDQVGNFTENLFAVKKEENWGFVNMNGELVIQFFYKKVGEFNHGLAPAARGFLYGVIDKKGSWFLFPEYEYIQQVNDSLWLWAKQGQMGFFHPKEKKFFPQLYAELKVLDGNYLLYSTGSNYGLLSPDRKPVLKPEFSTIEVYTSEKVIVASKKLYYSLFYLNGNLKVFMNYPFTTFSPYKEGMALVIQKGKYGFIDKDGQLMVSTQYDQARPFSFGMAAVRLGKKWGFVDKRENMPLSPYYDEVKDFNYNCAAVMREGKWGFINKSGKEITKAAYDEVYPTRYGNHIIKAKNKYGLVNREGVEAINAIYRDVEDLNESVIKIRPFNKYGLVTLTNKPLTEYIYDEIYYSPESKKYIFVIKKDWQPYGR